MSDTSNSYTFITNDFYLAKTMKEINYIYNHRYKNIPSAKHFLVYGKSPNDYQKIMITAIHTELSYQYIAGVCYTSCRYVDSVYRNIDIIRACKTK